MDKLLFSLGLGAALIVATSFLLVRFTTLNVIQTTVVVIVATLGVYLPLAFMHWPGSDMLAIHLAIYLLVACGCGLLMGVWKGAQIKGEHKGQGLHWGPAAIIGFFVCLLAVDSVLILVAEQGLSPQLISRLLPEAEHQGHISSGFPGVVSHDFQEKETLFNDYLKRFMRQQERGWQIRKGWLSKPILGESAVFRVAARTQEGDSLTGAQVTGRFVRPADSRLDTAFTMWEVEPGVYQASLSLPAPGLWNLVLQLRKGEELHEIRANTSVSVR